MKKLNSKAIDVKWQKQWATKKVFEVSQDIKKKKYYVLAMYPYPSGSGLHMGHAFQYMIPDILSRFMIMQGYSVLNPMGFDSFGLPAENAAIKDKTHPKKYTDTAIRQFVNQLNKLGMSFNWGRMLASHDEQYYRWNQFFFLEMYKKGLIYRKNSSVNWCESCLSVLANEQVHDGKCWRHSDTTVSMKPLEQWFIKTTQYAEELLKDVDKLDWPERIKIMQKNWIGKSEGAEILFDLNGEKFPVFTTRADTLFGVTFLVMSAQHPKLQQFVTAEQKLNVESYLQSVRSLKQEDIDTNEKVGVFSGSYATHPLTGARIPVWIGNFVLADYGSGVVMAVPAHDARDYVFAKKYSLPIVPVIESIETKIIFLENSVRPEFFSKIARFGKIERRNGVAILFSEEVGKIFDMLRDHFMLGNWYAHSEGKIKKIIVFSPKDYRVYDWNIPKELDDAKKYAVKIGIPFEQLDFDELREAYTGKGILINSKSFSGLSNDIAYEKIIETLTQHECGRKVTQYKLRDWLVSRQRYWGTPIPIVYCNSCGVVPCSIKDLPVKLPAKVTFGKGNPLLTNSTFVNTKCPKCKEPARRETDTMDTFFDSSWYYLRFTDSQNKKMPFSKDIVNYWMPVDFYTGGAEHACMHLIYARFFTKALRDMGYLSFSEPFTKLFNQGMVHGEDGVVMSKSRGNGVDPLEITKKYGADVLRLFLVSVATPDKDFTWDAHGIEGTNRFIQAVWQYSQKVKLTESSKRVQHKIHSAIKTITQEIRDMKYNMAVIALRELFNSFEDTMTKKDFGSFVKLLSVFCPHIAEEIWHTVLKETSFVSISSWPKVEESKIDESIDKAEAVVNQTVSDISHILTLVKEKTGAETTKIYLYTIPPEVKLYDSEFLSNKFGKRVEVFAVNDAKKYDPQGKASKAKPGKPAIYVE